MKLLHYLKETKKELEQVVFPTSSLTVLYTILVIVVSLLVALMLSGVDFGFKELLKSIVTA